MNEAKPEAGVDTVSEEQAADLARLKGMAEEAPGAAQPQPEAAGMSVEESLAGLLQVVGVASGALGYARVQALWNEETCKGLADRTVPVLKKYPWGGSILAFLGGDSGIEEMALGMCLLPLVMGTVNAVRADSAEKREKEKAQSEKAQSEKAQSSELEKAGLSV